jgi:hypothetical protein
MRAGGKGGEDLWFATRANVTDDFGVPQPATALNSDVADTAPELSADGLMIVFGSDRMGGLGSRDIWMSTRASRIAPWTAPTNIFELSSPADETAPTMDGAMVRVIMNASSDLLEARRSSADLVWESPVPIAELNTAEAETAPMLDASGLVLYFSQARNGGALDIYRTERATLDGAFAPPELVAGPNTGSDDTDPWVSPDGRVMFFATNRDGNDEIYSSSR